MEQVMQLFGFILVVNTLMLKRIRNYIIQCIFSEPFIVFTIYIKAFKVL